MSKKCYKVNFCLWSPTFYILLLLFIIVYCSHTVNLLTNMPVDSFEQLLTPINESGADSIDNKDIEYDGKNMESIVVLLNFLHHRLERVSIDLPTEADETSKQLERQPSMKSFVNILFNVSISS